MIILVGSQKGGVGKSTIAVNIAAELARISKDVMLVDSDRQGTSNTWGQIRSGSSLPRVQYVAQYEQIHPTLQDLNKRFEFVIWDCAGRDSLELRSGMLVADLLIAPFRPSKADLDTIDHLNSVVKDAKMINPTLTCKGVLSMAPTNPIINERIVSEERFKKFKEFTMFDSAIHERKIYRDCMHDGRGVVEGSNIKASQEIKSLVGELLCLL